MALVVYPNKFQTYIVAEDHPESFDDLGRPDISFIHTILESVEIEAIYNDDPSVFILIEGVQYSLFLCDQLAATKRLPVNQFATKIALELNMIDSTDNIRGPVIFVALSELGEDS